jgi:hypothetical protein
VNASSQLSHRRIDGRSAILVAAIVATVVHALAGTGPVAADELGGDAHWSSTGVPPTTATPPPVPTAPNPDNDHLFTFGDIQVPPGEPGELSVVAAGMLDESGYVPLVIRNNRDHTVYDVGVLLLGTDDAGAEVATAEYSIPTAGVAPGEWTFGQNAVAAPGLASAGSMQLQMSGSAEPGAFVGLDITSAELRRDAIVGTVQNMSQTVLGNFNHVNVACFDGSQITGYQLAPVDATQLAPGDSAGFATSLPIDPVTCTAFAAYAIGLPAS